MKLEIVNFNKIGGVDITDDMCRTYDVSRICNRWPLRIFYHLLNAARINASNVYHLVLPEKKMRCLRLLEKIRMELVQPQRDMGSELPNLNKIVKISFTDSDYITISTIKGALHCLSTRKRCKN
ncbi:uncharacterized protein TNCV_116791 [Trichonephila clavipes]|nr:uncharacterized protein TNCV_116791 [Trichonephila clavipes]